MPLISSMKEYPFRWKPKVTKGYSDTMLERKLVIFIRWGWGWWFIRLWRIKRPANLYKEDQDESRWKDRPSNQQV